MNSTSPQSRFVPKPRTVLLAVLLAGVMLGLWNCNYPDTPAAGNSLPTTRLANVPANDTIAQYISLGVIPEITLFWLGDDPDGYVVAYRYRWIDFFSGQQRPQPYQTVLNLVSIGPTPLERMMLVKGNQNSIPNIYTFFATLTNQDGALISAIGDSLATGRTFAVPYKTGLVVGDSVAGADSVIHRSPTTGRFIFDSPADSNMHRFEVSSIDNNGGIDPNPAYVNFWTLRSPAPLVTVTAPVVNTQISAGLSDTNQIAIRHATDRFPGLRIDFSAIDFSTDERVFSWAVDDTLDPASWSPWSENTFALVTASSFKPIVTGWHNFYVRAKNRWGVLSNIATYRHSTGQGSFKATIVAIDSVGYVPRILVINSAPPPSGAVPWGIDTTASRNFYSGLLDAVGKSGKYDIWTVAGRPIASAFPSVITLGQYSTVILLMDQKLPAIGGAVYQFDPTRQTNMKRYLTAGGNLIFSGPVNYITAIQNFEPWSVEIFHTLPSPPPYPQRMNINLDFRGTRGHNGYPDLTIDPAKLPADSLGSLRQIIVNIPAGFGETIGWFNSRTSDPIWNNAPVGIRFLAPDPVPPARRTYSVVHFGFPLYYAEQASAIQAMQKALTDVHELP